MSLRRTLKLSSTDGVLCNVMVGMGETNFPALLLALGKSATVAGLVGSVPLLAGAVLQLATPRFLVKIGSHRAWVVACASMQALALAVLAVASLRGHISTPLAFAIVALYFASAQAAGAGWNGWIEQLVPSRIRPRYFATRNRYLQASLIGAVLLSGLLLDAKATFAGVLAIAVIARIASIYALTRQPDVATQATMATSVTIKEFVQRLRGRADGRVMRYVLMSNVAVYFAAPYFTPYMLKRLELPYRSFMLLTAAIYIGRICIYPVCARILKKLDAKTLLWVGGAGITLLPLPWIFTTDFKVLLAVQILSGFAWGCFEMATFFLYLETIPANERAAMLSAFNLCNACAMVIGATLGGALLAALGAGNGAYFAVFAISAVLRLATLGALRQVGPAPKAHMLAPVMLAPVSFARGFDIRMITQPVPRLRRAWNARMGGTPRRPPLRRAAR
ncbi:MAG: MFS transporter [Myxococcota bacterium]|nr:MFS transporter [Myxococcota bacterium]